MPLWRIYHESSIFTPAQQSSLAAAITKLYTEVGLPAFYVNVIFIPSASSIFIGGVPAPNFVRFTIEQMARKMKAQQAWLDKIDKALAPHLKDRGDLSWEYHILETERQLWRINGIVPPEAATVAEARWAREGKATEYAEEENVVSNM